MVHFSIIEVVLFSVIVDRDARLELAALVSRLATVESEWALLAAAAAALGIYFRRFVFVGYAAIYGYIGVSSELLREMTDGESVLAYFVVSGASMIVALVLLSRRFARSE